MMGSRVMSPLEADLGSVLHFPLVVKVRIGGGEGDPRSLPRGNFTLEHCV
jgi:hypothetical protein